MTERAASLSDEELERLLEPRALPWERAVLRGQLLVSLIVEAGLRIDEAARLRAVDFPDDSGPLSAAEVPARTRSLIELAISGADRRHLLASRADRPPSPRALRELALRFGAGRGVEGVSPERLVRTYARRAWTAGVPERVIARRLGIREVPSLRRKLRKDPLWVAAAQVGVVAGAGGGAEGRAAVPTGPAGPDSSRESSVS
ncbi:site-specific integrase [Miltoncostaea oceani]|uniref:site-specific integrase n=1 Tax=Miltoncostaea oceani TaxID=2843216 RepID=UPI001C3C6E1C|nr:site-specific integrase [Miltoncostaea oceani]